MATFKIDGKSDAERKKKKKKASLQSLPIQNLTCPIDAAFLRWLTYSRGKQVSGRGEGEAEREVAVAEKDAQGCLGRNSSVL